MEFFDFKNEFGLKNFNLGLKLNFLKENSFLHQQIPENNNKKIGKFLINLKEIINFDNFERNNEKYLFREEKIFKGFYFSLNGIKSKLVKERENIIEFSDFIWEIEMDFFL